MKQASISSFFKRSATASNDLLPPSKKIKGDIDPSPPSSLIIKPKKEMILKKIEEDEEETVSTPPIPSSPPQNNVKFSDSGEDTEEDEDAQEIARKTLSRRTQSMPEHALKAAARSINSDEENDDDNNNRNALKRKRPMDDNSDPINTFSKVNSPKSKVDNSKSRLIMEHTLGSQVIQIRQGDITEECTGAIVNAANSHLAHGGGVAGAISRKGGSQIQSESDKWVRQNGTVAAGKVAVTGAGRLPCSNVIHAVGPIWNGGKRGEDKELFGAVWHSLLKAHQLNLPSISIPAISSGIFGFPKDRCAYIMTECAVKFCTKYSDSPLTEIRFTNFDNETVGIFSSEFRNRFGETENEDNDDNNDGNNDNNDDNNDNNDNNNDNNDSDNDAQDNKDESDNEDDTFTSNNNNYSNNTKGSKHKDNGGEDTEEDESLVQPTGYESDSD